MRLVRFLKDALIELVNLVADDPVLVFGAFIALGIAYAFSRTHGGAHKVTGPILFVLVWATIGGSLWRFVRKSTRTDS
jgi:hypothetical protein